jgi:hypothetical protein
MTMPTTPISTANVDGESKSPRAMRSDLLQAFNTLNAIMEAWDLESGNGICPIVDGKVPVGNLPVGTGPDQVASGPHGHDNLRATGTTVMDVAQALRMDFSGTTTEATVLSGNLAIQAYNSTGDTVGMLWTPRVRPSGASLSRYRGITVRGRMDNATPVTEIRGIDAGAELTENYLSTTKPAFTGFWARLVDASPTAGFSDAVTFEAPDFTGLADTHKGFVSLQAAGTGFWNAYLSGSAMNYANGAWLIGTTTHDGTSKLQVSGQASVTSLKIGSLSVVFIDGSATWNPASIASGAMRASSTDAVTITCTGAALGDFVQASCDAALSGLDLRGEVTAANTVTLYLTNNTGGAVDLASATFRARVFKK